VTEEFKNDSVLGVISSSGIGSLGANNLTIHYDAVVNNYIVVAGGRSETFTNTNLLSEFQYPADASTTTNAFGATDTTSYWIDRSNPSILPNHSSAGLKVYTRASTSTVDQLILSSNTVPTVASFDPLNPIYQGADIILSYVGFGSWFSGTVVGSDITGSFDYFTYGAFTSDTAMPRTGTGKYSIIIDGRFATDRVGFLSGRGQAVADFAAGTVGFRASNLEWSPDGSSTSGIQPGIPYSMNDVPFMATAAIASGANEFSGTFDYKGSFTASGPIHGRFYGPNAQELGAVFSGQGAGGVVEGAIVGSLGSNTIK
jgi:hypothetical protein